MTRFVPPVCCDTDGMPMGEDRFQYTLTVLLLLGREAYAELLRS